MAKARATNGRVCPSCGKPWTVVDGRCGACGIDAGSPHLQAIEQADQAFASLQAEYDALTSRWQEWTAYRETMVERLQSTRVDPAAPTSPPVPDGQPPAPSFAEPVAPGDAQSSPAQPAAQAVASTEALQSAGGSQGERPVVERHTPRVLTAPVLLGVSGASLMIAAALVFVAVTWRTFFPFAQGLLVLAVGVAVAALALWLRRLSLVISAGAVAVVAMGFAGVSVLAFDREAGALSYFTAPVALAAVAVAGLVLSRMRLRWTGAAAGLAAAAVAITATVAAVNAIDDVPGPVVFALAGALFMGLVVASYQWWPSRVARVLIKYVGVAWLTLAALSGIVLATTHPAGSWAWNGVALVPIAVLIVVARWWPVVVSGPLAALATAVAWSVGTTLEWDGFAVVAVTAAVAAAVVLGMRWMDVGRVRTAVWWGLAPAGVVLALAAVTLALHGLIAVIFGSGTPTDVTWQAAVAAVVLAVLGASIDRSVNSRGASASAGMASAIMTVAAAGIAVALVAGHVSAGWITGFAYTAVAAAVASTAWWWRRSAERWLVGVAGVVLATIAGGHALNAIAESAQPWWGGTITLVIVLGALWGCAWWRFPRLTGIVAALLTSLVAPAVAMRADLDLGYVAVSMAGGLAVLAALGLALPERLRGPALLGLTPALGASAVGSVAAMAVTAVHAATGATDSVVRAPDMWLAYVAVAAAVAALVFARWRIDVSAQRAFAGTACVAGVGGLAVLAYAVAAAANWPLPGVATAVVGAGLVSVALLVVAPTPAATQVVRVGATAVATIGGVHAARALSLPEHAWWWGAAVVLGVVALFVTVARWRPVLVLGSASALVTLGAWALAVRAEAQPSMQLAAVSAAVAVVVWAVVRVPGSWRVPSWWGLSFAGAAVVATVAVAAPIAAMQSVLNMDVPITSSEGWPLAGAAVGLALAIRAVVVTSGQRVSVAVLGVVATISAVIIASAAAIADANVSWAAASAIGVGGAIVVWVLAPWWPGRAPRAVARISALVWATVHGLTMVVAISLGDVAWVEGVLVVGVVVALLAVAVRWYPFMAALLATVLATTVVPAVVAGLDASLSAVVLASTASVAAAWWIAVRASSKLREPIRWGSVLSAAGALLGLGVLTGMAVRRWAAASVGTEVREFTDTDWMLDAGIAVVAFVAALSWPAVRRQVSWAGLAGILLLAATLPQPGPWMVLGVVALAVLWWITHPRISPVAVLIAAVAAVPWAWPESWSLATASAVVVTVSLVVAVRLTGGLRQTGLVIAPLAGFLTMYAALTAAGIAAGIAIPIASGTTLAMAIIAVAAGLDRPMRIAPAITLLATVALPWLGGSLTSAGLALLLAGAGWLGLAVLGQRGARWWAVGTTTVGAALILADAGVGAIEAYAAVPAAALIGIGLWWMRSNPSVHSMRALGPGLAVGLLASYIALMVDPEGLTRTLVLVGVTVMLALIGVLLRWFAPVLATAVTAVVVSVAQIFVGSNVAVKVIAFAVVGAILLGIATLFEKLKELR